MYKLINFCSVVSVIATGTTMPLRNLADDDDTPAKIVNCPNY